MNRSDEYATLYTKQERIRLAIVFLFAFLFLLAVVNFILFPEWSEFIASIHCHTIMGIPGIAALVYGVFVGIPIVCGIILELIFAWVGIRTIIEKRSPPEKSKVFKKTKILYGREAVLKGVFILLFIPAFFVPVISWGYLQAGDYISRIDVNKLDYSVCVKQINNL